MSDQNPPAVAPEVVQFGTHFEWPFIVKAIERTKRSKGADGKTTSVKEQHPVIVPVVSELSHVIGYTNNIFNAVEARSPGSAVKLFEALFGDRIVEASDESFDANTGEENRDKLVELHLQVDRPRSAGMKIDEINSRLATLAPEYMALINASSDDKWSTLVSQETGGQLFDSIEAFTLRLSAVINEMTKLVGIRQEKEKKSAEIKAKREEKQRKANEAAKTLAATPPAVPTN